MTDTRATDALLTVNKPVRVGNVFKTDEAWEGNNSDFFSVIKEKDKFRMYYLGNNHPGTHPFYICYAESTDGINWVKPDLGLFEFNGSKNNQKDGFASYKAPCKEKTLRTGEFTFEGERLYINFKTSARGYVKVSFLDDKNNQIEGYESAEHFGDTTKRFIRFEKSLTELHGKTVKPNFEMFDSELYSFCLEDN